jgi:hypothetical protein
MHGSAHKYLAFRWGGLVYEYKVLPFGLNVAPFIFVKVTKQLVAKWRAEGIKVIVHFLDDIVFGLSGHEGRETEIIEHVLQDLKHTGFVINIEKSVLTPTRKIECLGFWLDTSLSLISVGEEKLNALVDMISRMLRKPQEKHSVRYMAQIAGKLQSMKLAMGPVVMVHLRRMYLLMNTVGSWRATLHLEDGVIEDLKGVCENIRSWNGQPLGELPFQHIVHTDASAHALGGCIEDVWVYEEMSLPARMESSTFRELLAIVMLIRKLRHLYKNSRLLFRTDNQAAYYILKKGGSWKEGIMCLVREVYKLLWSANIAWDIQWIPRGENTLADYVSKQWDQDDWSVSDEVFEWLDSL